MLTAQEDGTAEWDDAELLRRAGTLGRILFTQDDDFLVEVARLQREGKSFPTVVYAHQLNATVRECVDSLELISKATTEGEHRGQVIYIPF